MKPSNKYLWKIGIICLLMLLFSLSFRIDLNNQYPKGVDTYDLYALSKNVQEKGYVVWNIDFATALGLTSISYPSGGIIFLAEISSITGMSAANAILVFNMFLIIMCGILMFLISEELFKNRLISFFSVLIYLNARFFIAYSTFFTARNILHVFFLAILFLLLKKIDIKKILMIGIILAIAFFTHRATILIGVFILAVFITKIMHKFYENRPLHNLIILAISILLFLSSVYLFGYTNIGSDTNKVPFNVGNQYIQNVISTIFSISMQFGILIILLPLGYLLLLNKKEKDNNDMFILISFALGCALMFETTYFLYLFLPILVLIISYFFEYILSSDKKSIKILIVPIIIISLIIPIYVTITQPRSDVTLVRNPTIGLTKFLDNQKIEKSIICNNHVVYCSQIFSLSKNVTALTYTSGRTMMENITIMHKEITLKNIRSKIIFEDNILRVPLFADTYTSAIINWSTNPMQLKKLVEFTNLGYIIDSNNPDSIQNREKIQLKFGDMNQIYDNSLQQVKVIN